MYNLKDFFEICDKYAPIILSKKMIEIGEYDNSGIIVNSHDNVEKVLFALDLSEASLAMAKKLKCDTIVTHHPAIYYPIKSLIRENAITSPILGAAKSNMNVISMHLNLDVADNGIDQSLAVGLGAKKVKILDYLDETHGYGREFTVNENTLLEFVKKVQDTFKTKKVIYYGDKNSTVKKIASFCGGGATHAEKAVLEKITEADTIVTSDMAHHDIKYLSDSGKNIVLLTHYASEQYGFNNYFKQIESETNGKIKIFNFEDKRFL